MSHIKSIRNRRVALLKEFILEMIIPDSFSSEDAENLLCSCTADGQDQKQQCSDFCEWFDLGAWFEDEMVETKFELEDFLVELRDDIEKEEREAAEDYREIERDYRSAQVGGLC